MAGSFGRLALAWLTVLAVGCKAPQFERLRDVPADLAIPPLQSGDPAPGRRVRLTAPEYVGTGVHHVLYLPTDWVKGRTYPVIVEFAGNGPYHNRLGDVSTGYVEDVKLGYGISGGEGCLWLCLPFVDPMGRHNQRQWWGSVRRTVDYCKAVVPRVCARYGGDPKKVVLAGFSRGAIACNYIGLHDDEIAALWCGFVCHSHYDGVQQWPYPGSSREDAVARLARLGTRPQWISHERSVAGTEQYLREVMPSGAFTFRELPFDNHTDEWVLRGLPLRREIRDWLARVTRAHR